MQLMHDIIDTTPHTEPPLNVSIMSKDSSKNSKYTCFSILYFNVLLF